MNSYSNSDSKQCPKSKLSRVHSAPTLGPGCVHTAHWAGHVVAHQASCRRPPPIVSWPSSRLCLRPHRALCRASCPCAPTRAAVRHVTASSAVSRASRPYCGTCPAVSQHCIVTQPTAKPSSYHDTNDCIVTHLSDKAALLS